MAPKCNASAMEFPPMNRGGESPNQTQIMPVQFQMSRNHRHVSPGAGDCNAVMMRRNMFDSFSDRNKNDESSITSSSSTGILAVQQQYHTNGSVSIRDKENATEHHSISFDLDTSDNHDLQHCRTPQRMRRQRAQEVESTLSSSASVLPPQSPPKLCLGNISDLVDDALTRVADAMFDSMRCGMDDTCHRWTYVAGEDGP